MWSSAIRLARASVIVLALLLPRASFADEPAHAGETRAPTATPGTPSKDPVLNEYLGLHAALAADRAAHVGPAAKALTSAAVASAPDDRKALLEKLAAAASAVEGTDISKDRASFKKVADATIAYVGAAGTGGATLEHVHCSMYPGSWLQGAGAIRNPYYGAEMLTCGERKGTFGTTGNVR